jgi:hypothetical protein
MSTDVMTKVELTVNVGSTPITGWVDDERGRHEFAGWLELVTIVAAAVAPRTEGTMVAVP